VRRRKAAAAPGRRTGPAAARHAPNSKPPAARGLMAHLQPGSGERFANLAGNGRSTAELVPGPSHLACCRRNPACRPSRPPMARLTRPPDRHKQPWRTACKAAPRSASLRASALGVGEGACRQFRPRPPDAFDIGQATSARHVGVKGPGHSFERARLEAQSTDADSTPRCRRLPRCARADARQCRCTWCSSGTCACEWR
jgi:hypothetical protein